MAFGKVKVDQIESSTQVVDVDDVLQSSDLGTTVQAYDADLAAVAALSTTGLVVRTGAGTAATVTAPSGNIVGTTDSQTLTNKTLTDPQLTGAPYLNGSYRGNIVAVAALDIDCSTSNYFTKTVSTNSTFTFSGVPSSSSYSFTLCITHSGGSITWPASVKWPQNTAPSLTTNRYHKFMFITNNGGTLWYGASLINYAI